MTDTASPPTVLREIPGPDVCEMCGAPGLRTELIRDPFIYGREPTAVQLIADIPVHSCTQCDISFLGEAAGAIQHEAVCRHHGVLTPDEIRELRASYGMSRAAFARLTGFGEATLARWERREVIQSTSSDRYLRLLKNPVNVDDLLSLTDTGDSRDADSSGKADESGERAAVDAVLAALSTWLSTQEVEDIYARAAEATGEETPGLEALVHAVMLHGLPLAWLRLAQRRVAGSAL